MKADQNYINRLEVGDKFENSRGETCKVIGIDKWGNIRAGTVDRGESHLRIYNKSGKGSPSSGDIKAGQS